MKPRDRRQFAAVVRAVDPSERAAALSAALARLGRWREHALPLDHIAMAPIHVLARAATGARMRSEALVVELTHGRLILEAGVDWEQQPGDLRDLAVLFRRIRLDWHGATLELTLEGRPAPYAVQRELRSMQLIARSPDGLVLCDNTRTLWIEGPGATPERIHPYAAQPLGRFVLDVLASTLACTPSPPAHPLLSAVQVDPSEANWLVYGDWLQAQGDERGRAIVRGDVDPLANASEMLAAWLASPRADLLRFGLDWHRGHVIAARIEDASGPPLVALCRALLDGPEGSLLADLSISGAEFMPEQIIAVITAQTRPALRHLTIDSAWRPAGSPARVLLACPGLLSLAMRGATNTPCTLAHPRLQALAAASIQHRSVNLPALRFADVYDGRPGGLIDGAPRLQALRLGGEFVGAEALSAVVHASALRCLHIDGRHLRDIEPLLQAHDWLRVWITCETITTAQINTLRTHFGDRLALVEPDPALFWID